MINYLQNISKNYELEKIQDLFSLAKLLSLIDYSEINNITHKYKLKLELFNQLQERFTGKNFCEIETIYLDKSFHFGNTMILLNNLLYYAEILNISNIYLNSEMNWPLKNNTIVGKIKIAFISPIKAELIDRNIISFNPYSVYSQKVIRPEIRINMLKKEILRNLPTITIDPDDLYVHIRGGDIFKCKSCKDINYAQPPLCFYIKIIKQFKFKNIYIISEDKINPIISPLVNEFQNIILTQNLFQTDITILVNAYNLVSSMSSFITSLVIISNNLKNFWEYDNYRLTEKYLHLHHQIYKYEIRYNIYRMKSSQKYQNIMFPWKNQKKQIELMLNEKCDNFEIILIEGKKY